MADLLNESLQVARKDYQCNGSEWLCGAYPEMTYTQAKAFIRARRDGFRILKGQRYLKQTIADGGEIYYYRSRIDVHKVVTELDLFED